MHIEGSLKYPLAILENRDIQDKRPSKLPGHERIELDSHANTVVLRWTLWLCTTWGIVVRSAHTQTTTNRSRMCLLYWELLFGPIQPITNTTY